MLYSIKIMKVLSLFFQDFPSTEEEWVKFEPVQLDLLDTSTYGDMISVTWDERIKKPIYQQVISQILHC